MPETRNPPDRSIASAPELAALHEALFLAASDALLVVGDDGRILVANPAVEALLGRPAAELAGRTIEELVPARFHDHGRKRTEYAGHPRPRPMGRGLQLYARHADGQEIPVDISLTPVELGGKRLVAAAIRDLRGRAWGGETLRLQATALRSAANGVVITDRHGVITWVNPAACSITGYSVDELVGQHTRLLKSGEHDAAFYARIWETVNRGETWSGTIVNRRKGGELYHEEQTIAPVVDEEGGLTHFIAIKQDVTERHRLEAELVRAHRELEARLAEIEELNRQLREQAIRDPLTQLHNRRYFDEAIGREAARIARSNEPLSIAVIDVDRFKLVNDLRGHAAGDRVLQRLGEILRTLVRGSDLLCRIGGEEFVVVMTGANSRVAMNRAEAWRKAFAAESIEMDKGGPFSCTLSVGVAEHRERYEPIERTLARADEALYSAKKAGRNRVVSADAEPDAPGS